MNREDAAGVGLLFGLPVPRGTGGVSNGDAATRKKTKGAAHPPAHGGCQPASPTRGQKCDSVHPALAEFLQAIGEMAARTVLEDYRKDKTLFDTSTPHAGKTDRTIRSVGRREHATANRIDAPHAICTTGKRERKEGEHADEGR